MRIIPVTAFLISHVTCYVILFCKAIHTIDGLIECYLLFLFVKIKTLYIMIVHGLYTPTIHD